MRGGLKVLSGREVAAILAEFGFAVSGGTKHLKLRRTGPAESETLIVPNHDAIAKGTLRAIFSQASRYVPQAELRPHFYND
jgi:predicted RNA binding protein YcfA (HicA-like mRNA interferase family)